MEIRPAKAELQVLHVKIELEKDLKGRRAVVITALGLSLV